jgi:hypothetical protein
MNLLGLYTIVGKGSSDHVDVPIWSSDRFMEIRDFKIYVHFDGLEGLCLLQI